MTHMLLLLLSVNTRYPCRPDDNDDDDIMIDLVVAAAILGILTIIFLSFYPIQ